MEICGVDGCESNYSCKGYCMKHYSRVFRHGDSSNIRKLPKGHAARNLIIRSYKAGAKARNLEWALEINDLENLFKNNCYYCGDAPGQIKKTLAGNGNYIFNGIDRIDNKKGYVLDNVVSCCKLCNHAKNNLSVDEFMKHVRKIVTYNSEHFKENI